MLKRGFPVVVLVLIGVTVWLSCRPQVNEKSPQTVHASQPQARGRQPIGVTEGEAPPVTDISESPRHAVGEIERHQQNRAGIVELEKAVAQQHEKVEERRKILATITRTRGVIYKGTDSKFEPSEQSSETPETDNNPQLINQLGTLLKNPDDQLLSIAAGLDIPNNSIKDLYPQFLAARRDLEGLRAAGSETESSALSAQISRVDAMKSQLDTELASIRITMTEMLKTVEEESAQRARDAQMYLNAKRDLETDQQLLEAMEVKLVAEKERVKYNER